MKASWRQACFVQVKDKNFDSTRANNGTNTKAQAHLSAHGTVVGDCGDEFEIKALLEGTDGSNYEYNIDKASFFSKAGWQIDQVIPRAKLCYDFTLSVKALNAESVAAHQKRTSGNGYNNQNDDSATEKFCNLPPLCAVYVQEINFLGMKEKSDWRGPMLADFEGVIAAEHECQDFTADLRLHSKSTDVFVKKIHPELTKVDTYHFSFKTTIEGPNLHDYYLGELHAYDYSNAQDTDTKESVELLW